MRLLSGRADILLIMNELIDRAETLGCRVLLTEKRRISFHPEKIIFLPPLADLPTLYALAHEMGHLIDFLDGRLDYERWKNNQAYRVNAEMRAWVNAYSLLREAGAPLAEWQQHVRSRLSTYFLPCEVS